MCLEAEYLACLLILAFIWGWHSLKTSFNTFSETRSQAPFGMPVLSKKATQLLHINL